MEALLSTYLPPAIIVFIIAAIIFLTNYMTNKRITDLPVQIWRDREELRSQIHREFEELRSQMHLGDAAISAEVKTKNQELRKQVDVLIALVNELILKKYKS